MRRLYTFVLAISFMICVGGAAPAGAQLPANPLQDNPVYYFSGVSVRTWVGNVRFMLTNYSDTLTVRADSAGRSLLVSRVLVDEDDTVVVSRGQGMVLAQPGDSTYQIRWTEYGYDEATGLMRWGENQWEISFDGEWKQWFIRLRSDDEAVFTASLARAVGQFPPVELAGVTYRLVETPRPFRKPK